MLRIVQAGTGPRRLLFLSYFTANTAALLASIPPSACVMVDLDDAGGRFVRPPGRVGVETIGVAVARAMHEADFDTIDGVILIGWSAGCEAVRELLRAGINVDAVVALDGCSGSVPPTADQLYPWESAASRARAGNACVVLTHTAMGYTERLPVATRYESTTHTIAAITGTTGGAMPAEGQTVTPIDGALYVLAYPSGDIDGAAHIYQQTHVMPDVLRRIVVPWLLARGGSTVHSTTAPTIPPAEPTMPTGSIPPPSPRAVQPTLADVPRDLRRGDSGADVMDLQIQLTRLGYRIGCDGKFGPQTEGAVKAAQTRFFIGADGVVDADTRATIDAATDSLRGKGAKPDVAPVVMSSLAAVLLHIANGDVGIRETAHNDGPEIRRLYLDPLHLAPGSNWCAAAFRSWLVRACAELGCAMPIPGDAGAKATMDQFKRARLWVTVEEARANPALIVAGLVPVWDRAVSGDPSKAWYGHIGVTTNGMNGKTFPAVEGNSGPNGDQVIAWDVRTLDDPKLLGFGRLTA